MKFAPPGQCNSIVTVAPEYENFIGGKWLAPPQGTYRADLCPAAGQSITEVAHSTPEDIELALAAAHVAKDAWAEKSATERAEVLNAVADAIDANDERDEEPARQLRPQAARAVLSRDVRHTAVADQGHPGGGPGDHSSARRPGWPGDVRAVRWLLRRQHADVFSRGEFLVGDNDVLLGEIDGCPFYIDAGLDRAWHQDRFVLDVAAGPAEGFSLPAGDNLTSSSFLRRARPRRPPWHARNSGGTHDHLCPSRPAGKPATVQARYDNWIGGEFVAPVEGSTSRTRRR